MGPCSWRTGQQPSLHPDQASTGDGMRAPAWWPLGGSGSAKLGGAQLSPGTPVSTQPSLPPAGEVTSLPSSLEGGGVWTLNTWVGPQDGARDRSPGDRDHQLSPTPLPQPTCRDPHWPPSGALLEWSLSPVAPRAQGGTSFSGGTSAWPHVPATPRYSLGAVGGGLGWAPCDDRYEGVWGDPQGWGSQVWGRCWSTGFCSGRLRT